jgi:hypothetical protein
MKKFLLFVYFAGVIAFFGYSQSLSLSDSAGPVANNSTIWKWGSPNAEEIVAFVFVTNNTGNAIPVKVRKVEVNVLPGTINLFCWGLCFAPNVYESPDPLVIEGGATNNLDFSGHYTPNGALGISTMRYVFFNADNPSDTVCVNVNFDTYPQGIGKPSISGNISNPYPNPAGNVVNFDYDLPQNSKAALIIRNVLGSVVMESELQTAGKLTLNTSGLTDGVYFYSLIVNGNNQATRKLVIKH